MHSGMSGGVARVSTCMRGVESVIRPTNERFDRHSAYGDRRLYMTVPDSAGLAQHCAQSFEKVP